MVSRRKAKRHLLKWVRYMTRYRTESGTVSWGSRGYHDAILNYSLAGDQRDRMRHFVDAPRPS
jgi:hypothetical protein